MNVTAPWQTKEAALAAEERRKKHDEWVAQVERERAEAARAEQAAAVPKLHVHDGETSAAREIREARDLAVQTAHDETASARAAVEAGVDLSFATSVRRGMSLSEVGWDWGRWTEEGVELTLLGWIYRQRHAEGDRRAGGDELRSAIVSGNRTGVPDSEAKLKPRGTRKSGIDTILETTVSPGKFAARCILRDDDMASRADGTAGADLWNIKEDGLAWREDEELVYGELKVRFEKVFLRWADRGLLRLEPVVKWSPDDTSGIGRNGMPDQCRFTMKAIDEAEERIRGTTLARGPGNPIGTKTQRQRDEIRDKASWFYREWLGESKAGT